MISFRYFCLCTVLLATSSGLRGDDSQSHLDDVSGPQKLAAEHLPNPVRLHAKVVSGGLPEGDAAFAELKRLGIKTVISVDGAKPDVETAKRFGLRYVHLPHGYDGISTQRGHELAKAVRDLEGPIYIHCHHGKHRSPAAATVACVEAGLISAESGSDVLALAGTSPNYRGLYQSVAAATEIAPQVLDAVSSDFPEVAEIPPLAEAMVELEQTHDRLKKIASANWHSPQDHPDLDPAHQALLLREHFTEMLRMDEVAQEPEDYLSMMRDSEAEAASLEKELRAWAKKGARGSVPPAIERHAIRIAEGCKTCHTKFRDTPLNEKQTSGR